MDHNAHRCREETIFYDCCELLDGSTTPDDVAASSCSDHGDEADLDAVRHGLDFKELHSFGILDDSLVGHGSFGRVVCATDPNSGTKCALKLIDDRALGPDQQCLSSGDLFQRAVKEAQIHECMSVEPCVVPVMGCFLTRVGNAASSRRAVVVQMPLMSGDLGARLRQAEHAGWDSAQTNGYILQVVNAVRKCHANGILHRDLKPSNFLLDDERQLYLGDFGMAGFMSPGDNAQLGTSGRDVRTAHSSARQAPGGTLEFMSPARLLGKDDGTAGDWWSTGAIILQLLCGHSTVDDSCWPFQPVPESSGSAISHAGDAVSEDAAQRAQEDACLHGWFDAMHTGNIDFGAKEGEISEDAHAAVQGLLAPDPEQRWGLEEVLACGLIPDSAYREVAARYPRLAADMQELQEIRDAVRHAASHRCRLPVQCDSPSPRQWQRTQRQRPQQATSRSTPQLLHTSSMPLVPRNQNASIPPSPFLGTCPPTQLLTDSFPLSTTSSGAQGRVISGRYKMVNQGHQSVKQLKSCLSEASSLARQDSTKELFHSLSEAGPLRNQAQGLKQPTRSMSGAYSARQPQGTSSIRSSDGVGMAGRSPLSAEASSSIRGSDGAGISGRKPPSANPSARLSAKPVATEALCGLTGSVCVVSEEHQRRGNAGLVSHSSAGQARPKQTLEGQHEGGLPRARSGGFVSKLRSWIGGEGR